MKIKTKAKAVVPFSPNAVQRLYLDTLCPNWRANDYSLSGAREILLKARQFGFSTLILALLYIDTVNTPNTETVVIAHDTEATEKLFRIVRLYHDELPPDKRPSTRAVSKRELVYDEINSTFRVLTAGTSTSGRSATINNLHCSEVAFWPDGDIFTGLLQAVPRDGNAFLETTANGVGGVGATFHDEYQRGKTGTSAFTSRFFAWFNHEEYREQPRVGFVPDKDELHLIDRHDLTFDQLEWRRQKIAEPGMGNLFAQEYPADDVEAFRVSGKMFFTEWFEHEHVFETMHRMPSHWQWAASLDWGFAAPFAFLLARIDEDGDFWFLEELYESRLPNKDQVDLIKALFAKHGAPKDTSVFADPSMWAVKGRNKGVGQADIEDFSKSGLVCIKAKNERIGERHGWSVVRAYLAKNRDYYKGERRHGVNVYRKGCPNLIRTMPLMQHDSKVPEDMAEGEDHLPDTLRYILNSRPIATRAPKEETYWQNSFLAQVVEANQPIGAF